jgi:hypothetical protein
MTLHGSNGPFALSLHFNLLSRIPSATEMARALADIPTQGRAAVANSFLQSAEQRTLIVTGHCATALNRPNPAPAEVAASVNLFLDLMSIQVQMAASPEFQDNG